MSLALPIYYSFHASAFCGGRRTWRNNKMQITIGSCVGSCRSTALYWTDTSDFCKTWESATWNPTHCIDSYPRFFFPMCFSAPFCILFDTNKCDLRTAHSWVIPNIVPGNHFIMNGTVLKVAGNNSYECQVQLFWWIEVENSWKFWIILALMPDHYGPRTVGKGSK